MYTKRSQVDRNVAAALNTFAFVGGTALVIYAFGWAGGIGLGLLAFFSRPDL